MRTPILAVKVQLQLGWNTYLFFNSDIVNFVWGYDRKHCFALWRCFTRRWIRAVRWVRKSYLGPAEITSFSSWDFTWSNKHNTFWHVVSTGYFYVLFLWAITISEFCPLEIYKNLGLPLSTITFTVNSNKGNHFYKYINLFQILYNIKSVFSLKYTLRFWPRFFIFNFDLNMKHRSYFS